MKMDITFSLFTDMFHRHNRSDNFSYDNLKALYDYLEDAFGGEYELDVIEICCTYSELTLDEITESYGGDIEDIDDVNSAADIREWLEEYNFNVINIDGDLKVLIED